MLKDFFAEGYLRFKGGWSDRAIINWKTTFREQLGCDLKLAHQMIDTYSFPICLACCAGCSLWSGPIINSFT